MIKARTVFVLGAAANCDLKFPLGAGLRTKIIELLGGDGSDDRAITKAINLTHPDLGRVIARDVRQALHHALSIDNLIEHRAGEANFTSVAKLAIAAAISSAESDSRVHFGKDSANTTFGEIFRLVVGGCRRDQIAEALSRVAFITFNYDRALEEFFHRGLVEYSGLGIVEAKAAVEDMTILHVYGSLGDLEFGQSRGRYGGEFDVHEIMQRAKGLLTFSESIATDHASQIKNVIRRAETLVFLGCANHGRNMALLRPEDMALFERVYGTYYAPPIPDEYATPAIERYSEPGNRRFRIAIAEWKRADMSLAIVDKMHIEALTVTQLVQKYGAEWSN